MRIFKYVISILFVAFLVAGYLIYSGAKIVTGERSPTQTIFAKQSLQLLGYLGDQRVPHMLASLNLFHSDNKDDQQAGFSLLLSEVENGSCYSEGKIGWAYQKGLGVEPNLEIAISKYTKAAECGMTYWQIMLAHSFEEGYLGLVIDEEMALYWKEKEPKIHIADYNCWVASYYEDGYFPMNSIKLDKYNNLCKESDLN